MMLNVKEGYSTYKLHNIERKMMYKISNEKQEKMTFCNKKATQLIL